MASALPVAFRTLFICLFIFTFGFCAKVNSSSSFSTVGLSSSHLGQSESVIESIMWLNGLHVAQPTVSKH